MEPLQVQPHPVRVNLRVMAKKRYSPFPNGLGLEPLRWFSVIIQDTHWWGGAYDPSAGMQSVYSTAPAGLAFNVTESTNRQTKQTTNLRKVLRIKKKNLEKICCHPITPRANI